ncbi:rhomboid family protein [Stackebrandtia albiflava]|uniref:Rhomboid family protein n=1 Tax=Stackebrandtia albiflava TaxID=406432 RepID=A0A562VDJ8_9ACTN|nr:rhomboid family intramembrane serine protease [Stackebrandtia albiflava]TWJ15891.1 rhomboid family protein [Stackebrandtia albiflava]
MNPTPQTAPRTRVRDIALLWGLVTALLWLVETVDFLLPADLDRYGIIAWNPERLPHILLAPLLHSGYDHLSANTVPLLVLGALAAWTGLTRFAAATGVIVLISGLGVWFTSPPHTVTVGASGVVFGYFGYLVARGALQRSLRDILIAAAVVVVYGSILWGVLPQQPGISWQAHLFGLLGGLTAAWMLRTPRPPVATT